MMKLLLHFLVIGSLFLSSGCMALRYNVPNVTDYKIFSADTLTPSQTPYEFKRAENNAILPDEFLWALSDNGKKYFEYADLDHFFKSTGTTSFIVIRNDSIIYEKYFNQFQPHDKQTMFSITKSFTGTLTAIAIEEGLMRYDQPVSDFIPEFSKNGKEKITIAHLLHMTSGIAEADFKDIMKLFTFYYSKDHNKRVKNIKLRHDPGTHFAYSSMTTQILGMCLEKATGKKFVDYLQEKIWQPLGMSENALIALDKSENGKYFGGLAASPIDLAKLGRLYLNHGVWNGERIIPESWINLVSQRDTTNGRSFRYAATFWQDTYPFENRMDKNDFFAGGFRGQIIYVNPDNNIVIVRTGSKEAGLHWGRSVSKLSHFPLKFEENSPAESNYLTNLIGNYENQFGRKININTIEGKVILKENDEELGVFERSSKYTFEDKKHHRKIFIDMRKNKYKGVILEDSKFQSSFYSKF